MISKTFYYRQGQPTSPYMFSYITKLRFTTINVTQWWRRTRFRVSDKVFPVTVPLAWKLERPDSRHQADLLFRKKLKTHSSLYL